MDLLYDTLFNGLAIGSVLVLAALGLAVVFGLMGVINMAHGELMMLGAYTTFVVQNIFKAVLPDALFPIYILVALPCAFLVSGLAGLLLEKTVIRRLYGRPLETLLATWGVSLILQQFVRSVSSAFAIGLVVAVVAGLLIPRFTPKRWWQQRWTPLLGTGSWVLTAAAGIALASLLGGQRVLDQPWFSARNIDVTAPVWLRGSIDVGAVTMPAARLFIIALTIVALLLVSWFLQKSVWGMRIRAVTQNRTMSDCLGIPTEKVDALTFLIGSGSGRCRRRCGDAAGVGGAEPRRQLHRGLLHGGGARRRGQAGRHRSRRPGHRRAQLRGGIWLTAAGVAGDARRA